MRFASNVRATFAGTLAALMALTACGGNDSSNAAPRQIELAPSKTTEPQLADVPLPQAEPAKAPERAPQAKRIAPPASPPPVAQRAVEAPVAAPAPATEAVPPAPTTGSIEAGASLTLKPATKICTNTHRAGDRFTAVVATAVEGTNGARIPAGAIAIVRIVEAPANAKAAKDGPHIVFDILSVRVDEQTYEVAAHVTQSAPLVQANARNNADKAKAVGVGAAIGAIAGRVLGGNTKSTVIGGVIGAAAGVAVAASDKPYEGCLSDDGTITVALDKPLVLRLKKD